MRRWWVLPLAIFAASRLIESLLLQSFLGLQHDLFIAPGGGPPHHWGHQVTLLESLTNWDGAWYREIVQHGYPHHLPRRGGAVVESPWAFYPLFPGLVRLVMFLGLSFAAAAAAVSTICGALASCVLFKFMLERVGRFTAAMTVLGLMFAPAALIFQAAYTESLALLLLLLALGALSKRRYGWFVMFTLLLGFARPVALPLALVCGVHVWSRWRRRAEEPFDTWERIKAGGAAVLAAVSFGIWPAVVALRTGAANGYFETQAAWARHNGAHDYASWLLQALHLQSWIAVAGVVAVAALVVWLVVRRSAALWGAELRTWTWVYPLYILGTTRPTTSLIRYLLLTVTPWWPVPEVSERAQSVRARAGLAALVVVVGIALQVAWILFYFIIWQHRQGAP